MTESISNRWAFVVAEGIAVTIGVLFAFAMQAWWEESKELEDQERLLIAVAEELEQANTHLDYRIDRLERHQKRLADGLNKLNNGEEKTADEMTEIMIQIGLFFTMDTPRTAIDDLVGSGSFRLVENPELRAKLNEYRQELRYTSEMHKFVREAEDRFINYALRHGNLLAMADNYQWQYPEITLNVVEIEPELEKLLLSREMSNHLWNRISFLGLYRQALENQRKSAATLQEAIEGAIGA